MIGKIIQIPIGDFWKESYLAVGEVASESAVRSTDFFTEITNLSLLFAIFIFFLFTYRRILDGLFFVFSSLFSVKKLRLIEDQSNMYTSRNTLFLFLTCLTCFIYANYYNSSKIAQINYPVIVKFLTMLLLVFSYFLLKKIALYALDWVNSKKIFKLLYKISFSYAIFEFTLLLSGFLLLHTFKRDAISYMPLYALISTLLCFTLYIFSSYKIILSNGFSHFFYILYLCTLEILPITLLSHIVF